MSFTPSMIENLVELFHDENENSDSDEDSVSVILCVVF